MSKSMKVYTVHTGIAANRYEGECLNWSKYNVLANDAEGAISTARKLFTMKGEYVKSVEFVGELSEAPNKASSGLAGTQAKKRTGSKPANR